jgi:ABC-type transport system involved in multi-copper enzyme maturation permease subunit
MRVNPVLARELRQRVRSRRANVVLTGYLTLLSAAVGLLVWGLQQDRAEGTAVTQGTGQTLFGTLLFGILGLVCFIVPGVAAGAVAGERERLTLVPLQVTLLTPGQVLRGKLLASLAFTTLLLVATLPLLAVAYVLGGVSVPEIAGGLALVLASAAFLGVVSIWASTLLRRVQRATVVSYGLVGLLVLGTPVAYGVQVVATGQLAPAEVRGGFSGSGRWESLLLVAPNPFLVTADALGHSTDGEGPSPFTPAQDALRRRDDRRNGVPRIDDFGRSGGFAGPPMPFPGPPPFGPDGAPLPTPAPMPSPPTTMVIDPSSAGPFVPGPGGVVIAEPGSSGGFTSSGPFPPAPDRGDVTDWGPIWLWTFGWWALLGGAAYVHAVRRLRLPSRAGVRP